MHPTIVKMDLSEEIQKIVSLVGKDVALCVKHADVIAEVGLVKIASTYILYCLEDNYAITIENRPVLNNEHVLFGRITNLLNTIHYSIYGGFSVPYGVNQSCHHIYERSTLSLVFKPLNRRNDDVAVPI